jgi:hypothetical protein
VHQAVTPVLPTPGGVLRDQAFQSGSPKDAKSCTCRTILIHHGGRVSSSAFCYGAALLYRTIAMLLLCCTGTLAEWTGDAGPCVQC